MKKTLCQFFALLLTIGLSMPALAGELPVLQLSVEGGSLTLTLEDNSAARSLFSQLPLTLTFEDYNGMEKVAYPPEALDLSDAPDSCHPGVGTLAYYAPWGNLCIFYGDFQYSEGLVPLGHVEGGMELLTSLEGNFIADLNAEPTGETPPTVYMTTEITPEGLMDVYEALGREAFGENVAVKISTGETGSNYLRPELIGDFVQAVGGTIVECNTAYGGQRASTAMHYQLAVDHGYTAIADVDIMDENGSMTLSVTGGSVLTENYVGVNLQNYDFLVVLSHFKGHAMAGFGGAIKNLSIGCASSEGKAWIHSGGTGGSMWGGEQDAFLEAMAEAAKSVVDFFEDGERALYINVMNRLSVDCDCDGNPAEPDMHDIGILASLDPVALDQACIDLVYGAPDGGSLIQRIESRNGLHTLEHTQDIGFGSRNYTLVNIDDGLD